MAITMKINMRINKVITIYIPDDFEKILDKYHYNYEAKISEFLIKKASELIDAEKTIHKIVSPADKPDSD